MQWVVKVGHLLVGAVNGQGVLGQVVRANGEEVGFGAGSVIVGERNRVALEIFLGTAAINAAGLSRMQADHARPA